MARGIVVSCDGSACAETDSEADKGSAFSGPAGASDSMSVSLSVSLSAIGARTAATAAFAGAAVAALSDAGTGWTSGVEATG